MSTTGFRGFDHTIQETNTWLHEIAERMDNPDRHMAYHALRSLRCAIGSPSKKYSTWRRNCRC